jgi:hypothetical protein
MRTGACKFEEVVILEHLQLRDSIFFCEMGDNDILIEGKRTSRNGSPEGAGRREEK